MAGHVGKSKEATSHADRHLLAASSSQQHQQTPLYTLGAYKLLPALLNAALPLRAMLGADPPPLLPLASAGGGVRRSTAPMGRWSDGCQRLGM